MKYQIYTTFVGISSVNAINKIEIVTNGNF